MLENYTSTLVNSPLFVGFEPAEMFSLIERYRGKESECERGEVILLYGERVDKIGIILEGYVDTVQEDYWGNQMLLGRFGPGQIFADSFVLAKIEALPFTAISYSKTVVLWLDCGQMPTIFSNACDSDYKFVENLMSITAKKNMILLTKIEHLGKRTLREKILSYFAAEEKKQKAMSSS